MLRALLELLRRPRCPICLERHRDLTRHVHVDHAEVVL